MSENKVFFRKVTKSMIIVTDKPLETKECTIMGLGFRTRTQVQARFGILCLIDKKTSQPAREDHPLFQQLVAKLLEAGPGSPIPGFRFSDAPVLDKEQKPTGMVWVEAV